MQSFGLSDFWFSHPEWVNFGLAILAWSTLAAFVIVLISLPGRLHPVLKIGLSRATLAALPLGLLLASLNLVAFFPQQTAPVSITPRSISIEKQVPFAITSQAQTTDDNQISVTVDAGNQPSGATLAVHSANWGGISSTSWLLLFLSALVTLQVIRLVRDSFQLWRFRQSLRVEPLRDYDEMLEALCMQTGIRRGRVSLAVMRSETVPMTFGWRKPMIVLPQNLLENPMETEMAILHELIHIRRHDYAWNWFERMCTVLFGFHPFSFVLQKRIERFREEICDTSVLSYGCYPADQYAGLLFRLSSVPAYRPALQMADTFMSLKNRLETMRSLVHSNQRIRQANRRAITAGIVVFGLMTFVVAGSRFQNVVPDRARATPEGDIPSCTMTNARVMLARDAEPKSGEEGNLAESDLIVKRHARVGYLSGACDWFVADERLGVVRMSIWPFEGAEEAGNVNGNILSLAMPRVMITIVSQHQIAKHGHYPLYARWYPNLHVREFAALRLGAAQVRLHAEMENITGQSTMTNETPITAPSGVWLIGISNREANWSNPNLASDMHLNAGFGDPSESPPPPNSSVTATNGFSYSTSNGASSTHNLASATTPTNGRFPNTLENMQAKINGLEALLEQTQAASNQQDLARTMQRVKGYQQQAEQLLADAGQLHQQYQTNYNRLNRATSGQLQEQTPHQSAELASLGHQRNQALHLQSRLRTFIYRCNGKLAALRKPKPWSSASPEGTAYQVYSTTPDNATRTWASPATFGNGARSTGSGRTPQPASSGYSSSSGYTIISGTTGTTSVVCSAPSANTAYTCLSLSPSEGGKPSGKTSGGKKPATLTTTGTSCTQAPVNVGHSCSEAGSDQH